MLRATIEFQLALHEAWFELHPDWPELYSLRPRVQWTHDPRRDYSLDAPSVAYGRQADCKDLSAYRVAWLRVCGGEPDARIELVSRGIRDGAEQYHARVRRGARGNHALEDPSIDHGMRG